MHAKELPDDDSESDQLNPRKWKNSIIISLNEVWTISEYFLSIRLRKFIVYYSLYSTRFASWSRSERYIDVGDGHGRICHQHIKPVSKKKEGTTHALYNVNKKLKDTSSLNVSDWCYRIMRKILRIDFLEYIWIVLELILTQIHLMTPIFYLIYTYKIIQNRYS